MIMFNVKKMLGIFLLVGGLVVPIQNVSAELLPKIPLGPPKPEISHTVHGSGKTLDEAIKNLEDVSKDLCENSYDIKSYRENYNPENEDFPYEAIAVIVCL